MSGRRKGKFSVDALDRLNPDPQGLEHFHPLLQQACRVGG